MNIRQLRDSMLRSRLDISEGPSQFQSIVEEINEEDLIQEQEIIKQ